MDNSIELTTNGGVRLISTIHQAYVNNRNQEMDRIDNSTGWSVGILVLMLSFMLSSGVPFYFVPFSIIVIIPFWIKESRRYVYYMFWSHKESEMESQIQHSLEFGRYNKKNIIEIMEFNKPHHLINIYKAMRVRFYRSYFWMTLLIYIATLLLAVSQGALSSIWIASGFILLLFAIILIGLKGKDEMILPRKTIMHLGIKYNI